VWKKVKGYLKNEQGDALIEYLVLALLIIGIVTASVSALKQETTTTHNNIMNNVTNITGSGY